MERSDDARQRRGISDRTEVRLARAQQAEALLARIAQEGRNDEEIVALLRTKVDLEAPEWIMLFEALIEYGYGVLVSWLNAGTIRTMAANLSVLGLARIPPRLVLCDEEAHDLTTRILEPALRHFQRDLLAGRWRSGSASLSTFFIGRCLMELPDAYEKWQRQQDRWANDVPTEVDLDTRPSPQDPEGAVLAAMQLDGVLATHKSRYVRAMLELQESGYSAAEIADMFSLADMPHTAGKVRTILSRAKREMREHWAREERGGHDGK